MPKTTPVQEERKEFRTTSIQIILKMVNQKKQKKQHKPQKEYYNTRYHRPQQGKNRILDVAELEINIKQN